MKPEISICVSHYNRARVPYKNKYLTLFPNLVESLRLAALEAKIKIELLVADYNSTDSPLKDWLPEMIMPFSCKIIDMPGGFSYAGKNEAAKQASSDILFFCDADMLVSASLLRRGIEIVKSGKAFFPVYQRFHGPDTKATYWGDGHGCSVVSKKDWEQNHFLDSGDWGSGEDDYFAHWFHVRNLTIREKINGFYHQWHPLAESKKEADLKEEEERQKAIGLGIPKILHFIWIDTDMPEWVGYNIDEFRRLNPDYKIMIHDEKILLPEYEEHYKTLTDVCTKADVLALSALKKYGGWYFDTDCLPFRPVDEIISGYMLDGRKFFVTEQHGHKSPALRIANGVLAATTDCEAWKLIDEYALKQNPPFSRCRFGPELFTELVERHPSLFTVGDWPFFYPAGIGRAILAYKNIRRHGNRYAMRLAPTCGQLPFILHLWTHGKTELTLPKRPELIAEFKPTNGEYNGKHVCYALHLIQWKDTNQPFQAIAEGLANIGCTVEVKDVNTNPEQLLDFADLFVTWNGRKLWYEPPAALARKQGIPALYMEHGFFDRKKYWQVDHIGILHWSSWANDLNKPAPSEGAERLKLVWPYELRPFGHRNGYVLVIGQISGDSQMDESELSESTTLDKIVSRTINGRIATYFRPHPQTHVIRKSYLPQLNGGLIEAIEGAKFAVTINSNAGNECLALGCPILCFGPAIYEKAGLALKTSQAIFANDFQKMMDGWMPDTEGVKNYLEWLACRQWNAEEFREGSVLKELIWRATSG